ncbi:unnamed protein product [Boreogadus saida]
MTLNSASVQAVTYSLLRLVPRHVRFHSRDEMAEASGTVRQSGSSGGGSLEAVRQRKGLYSRSWAAAEFPLPELLVRWSTKS